MNKLARIMIALLATSAGAASAQEIDCTKPVGRLDAVICADPEMRDYGSRIAAAYANASRIWGGTIISYARLDQREWLTGFRTIETVEAAIDDDCVLSDLACIREQLHRRVEDIESGAYVHSGVYRAAGGLKLLLLPGLANGYRVRVYDPANLAKADIVTADSDRAALWDGPDVMISTMGDANGLPLPAEDGCTLRLSLQPLSIQLSQRGSCAGHHFEGVYNRKLDETLRGYEMELH